jgi:hypothetical protein
MIRFPQLMNLEGHAGGQHRIKPGSIGTVQIQVLTGEVKRF